MSYYLQKVCNKVLREYYGDIVARVGAVLFKRGANPLQLIAGMARLPTPKAAQALAVLVQHNLVTWEEWRPGVPAYTLLHDRVLLILRFPRYVYLVREQFGEEGEMVVDVLLKEGQATASHIIVTSCLKLMEAASNAGTTSSTTTSTSYEQQHITIRNHLVRLIEGQFIQRCPAPQHPNKLVPILTIRADQLYSFPPELLDLKVLQQEIQMRAAASASASTTTTTSAAGAKTTYPDSDVLWRINYDRFHIEFRDSEVRNSIVRRIDPLAGECLGAMMKLSYRTSDPWAPCLNAVSAAEIRDQLKDMKYLDQYLKVLEEDSGDCVRKVGDAGGGQYRLDLRGAYQTLSHTLVQHIVQERFGSKAARIFRLIHHNSMMEQDQIGEVAMISKKDANLLTFRLLNDKFLHIHEVRKTLTPSPANKTAYLFHVEMNGVVRMCVEWCYKALYNLMVQRETNHSENARLLDKRTRVDSIVENLRQSGGTDEQVKEVEEMMTPGELAQVERISETQDRLFDSEIGLDETLFVLQMFLYYQTDQS